MRNVTMDLPMHSWIYLCIPGNMLYLKLRIRDYIGRLFEGTAVKERYQTGDHGTEFVRIYDFVNCIVQLLAVA